MSRGAGAAGGELAALAARWGLDETARERLAVLVQRLSEDELAPTSVRDARAVVDQHLADSLAGLEVEGVAGAHEAVDLGSGAGLPGLVLAVALPETGFALVESRREKCAYIASLAAALRLGNAGVRCTRAESWREGIGRHDLALARALAPQAVVLEYAAPLLREGGRLVDWRGARDEEDERAAERASEELGMRRTALLAVEPFAGALHRHLHVFEKVEPTPAGFPRRAGIARKRPLGR